MNKKYIKTISLSMVLLLSTPTVSSATSLGDIVMSTKSSAGSWTDPLGGGKYYSGGSFKVKLKTSGQYAPLFQYRLPGLKKGCSGIDLDGGFLQFLGLDKLKDQLADAGSSLIFGVIMGIEYTMPAIAAVFNKIRAWSNALQAMLQNACNMGQSLAKSYGVGKFQSDALNDAVEGTFGEMDDFLKGGDSALEKIKNLSNCTGDETLGDCFDNKKKLDLAVGDQLKGKSEKESSGGTPIKTIVPAEDIITHATHLTLEEFYTHKKIVCKNVSNNSLSDDDILFDKIKYVFFGDIGNNHDSVSQLKELVDKDLCIFKPEALVSMVSETESGRPFAFPTAKFSIINPLVNEEDAGKALVYGFSSISDKYSHISSNKINIPNRLMVYIDAPNAISKNPDTNEEKSTGRTRVLFTSSGKQSSSSTISIQWNGAFLDSLKAIEQLVDKANNKTYRLANNYHDTSVISTINTPLLLPGIKNYINVISKLEKKAKKETFETRSLKVVLAKINAVKFAKLLMESAESRVVGLVDGRSGDIGMITKYMDNIAATKKSIMLVLEAMNKEISSEPSVEIFEKLERDLNLESMKVLK